MTTKVDAPSPAASRPDPDSADDNLDAVLWVQTSAEYRALSLQTFRAAADHLDRALTQSHWDALAPERANEAAGLAPAVIMDIDGTVLDSSPYQARLVRAATARGITIVYICNRAQHLDEAKIANLLSVGMPVEDAGVTRNTAC